MQDRIAYQGITFDDVLLEPGYSDVLPRGVDVRTRLTRNITINLPILSAPMDTVTESDLAIALAQEGGIGIIHRNLNIADQTREVDKVKRSENGIIVDPITLPPDETVGAAKRIMEQNKISGVPITVNGYLKGILTRRDLRFLTNNDQRLAEVMTHNNLVTAAEHTTLEAAERILTENKVEKLLLVDDNYKLKGLITIKDIDKLTNFPNACKDARGRLRVGAAVGVRDFERVESLIRAGVDVRRCDPRRHGSGRHLHHARHLRRRRSADHGHCQCGQGVKRQRRPDHRRRRHPLQWRHRQGTGGGGALRDARQPVGRAGRESGTAHHLQGAQLQDVPRHGVDRGHDGRVAGSLRPRDRQRQGQAGAGGRRRSCALQGPAGVVHLPVGRWTASRHGLLRHAEY